MRHVMSEMRFTAWRYFRRRQVKSVLVVNCGGERSVVRHCRR